MVQNLCQEAGISGQKTNHSLRATGASQLFQVNAPEKIIQERTGHRSTDTLYKRTAEEQHMAVTKVLSSNLDVSYMSVLQQCKAVDNPANPALANLGMKTLHFSSKMYSTRCAGADSVVWAALNDSTQAPTSSWSPSAMQASNQLKFMALPKNQSCM